MTTATVAPVSLRYPSLEAMRVAHRELVARFQRGTAQRAMAEEVVQFLLDAQETGSVLEDDRARTEAQSILDYWASALYRLRWEPPAAVLVPFVPSPTPLSVADAPCPYPGLVPYTPDDARSFYGRQAIVEQLVDRLASGQLVVVAGPYGCGKTSLVQAGLLPALKSGALPGSETWRCFGVSRLGPAPLISLVQAVLPDADETTIAREAEALRAHPEHIVNLVQDKPALLVVDQLEDVFLESGRSMADDARAFLDSLVALVSQPAGQCRVVLVRSDANLGPADDTGREGADTDSQPGGLLLNSTYRVDVTELGTRELRDAVLQPAELVGLRYVPFNFQDKEAMVADLVRALVGIPVVTPLLQFVLLELWDQRDQGRIDWDHYRRVLFDPQRKRTHTGWAVAQAAERMYTDAATTAGLQAAIRTVVLRLIDVGRGSEITLKRVQRASLSTTTTNNNGDRDDPELIDEAVRRLEYARLIRFADRGSDPSICVQLVHSALPRFWDRLDRWLAQVRIDDEVRLRLEDAVEQWVNLGRRDDMLWGQAQLEPVRNLQHLTADQAQFVARSHAYIRRLERDARVRRRVAFAGGAVIVTLAVGVLAALAFVFKLQAEQAQQLATLNKSRELVAQSRVYGDNQPDLALLLGLQAFRLDSTSTTARLEVLSVLERNLQLHALLPAGGSVSKVAVSADGQRVGGLFQDTVRQWDASSLQDVTRIQATTQAGSVQRTIRTFALSADHARLAAVLDDKSIQVWDALNGQLLQTFPNDSPPADLAFSSTGDQVLSVDSLNGDVTESDVGTALRQVRSRIGSIAGGGAVFSPDASRVAVFGCAPLSQAPALCRQGKVVVFDVASGRSIWQSGGELPSYVKSVAFSPDGHKLVAGGVDGAILLWQSDGQSPPQVTQLGALAHPITSLAFSNDGKSLAAGDCAAGFANTQTCASGEIGVWDVERGKPSAPIVPAQPGGVVSLAFLPNGSFLAGGRGSAVAVWNMAAVGQQALALPASATSAPVVATLTGNRLAIGSCRTREDAQCTTGKIDIVDSQSDGPPLLSMIVNGDTVRSLTASPDGLRLASGGTTGTISVWDATNGSLKTTLQIPGGSAAGPLPISALAFSSTGQLASSGNGGDIWVWDLSASSDPPRSVKLPATNTLPIASLALSEAGDRLAAGSQDGTVVVWDVARVKIIGRPLTGHAGPVTSVALTSDGGLVAAGGADQTLIIWEVASGSEIGTPLPAPRVRSVKFGPAGQELTSSDGVSVTAWGLDFDSWDAIKQRACQIAQRNLTRQEWRDFQLQGSDEALCADYPIVDN